MVHIYAITGRSSVGKDTVYAELIKRYPASLTGIATYTTRPMRPGEVDGKQYFFVDDYRYQFLKRSGKIIEERCYDTTLGTWKYFTVDDEQFKNVSENKSIIITCSLEQVRNYQKYFGDEYITPIYIDLDDITLIERSIEREKKKEVPNVAEICRRFLSDLDEYTDDLKEEVGVTTIFWNDNTIDDIVSKVICFISNDTIRRLKACETA